MAFLEPRGQYPLAEQHFVPIRAMSSSGKTYNGPPSDHFDGRQLLRSRWRAAEIAPSRCCAGSSAVTGSGSPGRMGAEPARRHAPAARRRRQGAVVVRRPRQLADPDLGPQHPDRSRVVGARLACSLGRAEAPQRPRHCLRRAAADRRRAGVARPLRPSRHRDAVETRGEILPARDHAARQRCGDAPRRPCGFRRGVRLASARRTRQRRRGDAGADPALVGARTVRPQHGVMGQLCAGDARGQNLHRLRFRVRRGQAFPPRRRGAWPVAARDPADRRL